MRKFPLYKLPNKLNVGCAEKQMKGYLNLDIRDMGQEIVWDITDGIPFPDGSLDEVFSSHTVEHLDDEGALAFIVDALRVLKRGCLLIVRVPHINDGRAIYFGHKTFWNEDKIEALQRSETKMPPFLIMENKLSEGQLCFTLKKL